MKPIRLRMTAFGPFVATEELDFDALPSDRPFVVAGATGSGKSTIFDAVAFALYGQLPGHRLQHTSVRCDLASPRARCEVTLEFAAGPDRWRVTRRPVHVRAKLRGSGTTEDKAEALLERFEGGQWQPVSGNLKDVTARCAELVGLSAAQFQRVMLLPQGDFQRVLTDSSADRSALLRTLFGTEIYDRALEDLRTERRTLRERLGAVEGAARAYRQSAAAHCRSAAELCVGLVGSDCDRDAPAGAAGNSVGDAPAGAVVVDIGKAKSQRGGTAGDSGEREDEEVAALDDTEITLTTQSIEAELDLLSGLQRQRFVLEEQESASAAATATRAVSMAEETVRQQQRREEAMRRSACLAGAAPARSTQQQALQRAAAATRAVGDLDAARRAGDVHDRAAAEAETARRAAVDALAAVDLELDADCSVEELGELSDRCRQKASAAGRAHDQALHLAGRRHTADEETVRVKALEAELDGRNETRKALETEKVRLEERLGVERPLADGLEVAERQAEAAEGAVRARAELERSMADLEGMRLAVLEAGEVVAGLRDDHEAVQVRKAACSKLAGALGPRTAVLDTTAARADALKRLTSLNSEIDEARQADELARRRALDLLDAFVAGAASRLAADLTDGKPCAVCGATEHPAPAGAAEQAVPVGTAELAEANERHRRSGRELQAREAEMAALLEEHPGIAERCEVEVELAVGEARAAVEASQAAVEEERELGEQAGALQDSIDRLGSDLLRAKEAMSEAEVVLAGRRGALGADAECPPEQLRLRAEQAGGERDAARAAAGALEDLSTQSEQVMALLVQAAADMQRVLEDLAVARAGMHSAEADVARLVAELAESIDESGLFPRFRGPQEPGAAELEHLMETWTAAAVAVEDWSGLQRAVILAGSARLDADRALERRLAAEGFADAAEVREARLDEQTTARFEEAVESHDSEVAAVEQELRALGRVPQEVPDLERLSAAADAATSRAVLIHDRRIELDRELHSARAALADCVRLDAVHRGDRRRLELVEEVAAVLGGESTSRRMTLESWVLTGYLREVVMAANEHLRPMSRGRFQLDLADPERRGNAYVGLDLVVIDDHTGTSRPVASLSGGETFQASLSLALGLSDVITAAGSGRRMEALFVDEGFGSLDAEAVDRAVEVLDGLRCGGKMVGVVTHVPAMKEALPVAVEVRPRNEGGSMVVQFDLSGAPRLVG